MFQRFAAVIMRIREPKTTALIFASGKMVMLYRLYSIFVHLFLVLIDLPCSRFNAASMLSYFRCVLELRVNIFRSWLQER